MGQAVLEVLIFLAIVLLLQSLIELVFPLVLFQIMSGHLDFGMALLGAEAGAQRLRVLLLDFQSLDFLLQKQLFLA